MHVSVLLSFTQKYNPSKGRDAPSAVQCTEQLRADLLSKPGLRTRFHHPQLNPLRQWHPVPQQPAEDAPLPFRHSRSKQAGKERQRKRLGKQRNIFALMGSNIRPGSERKENRTELQPPQDHEGIQWARQRSGVPVLLEPSRSQLLELEPWCHWAFLLRAHVPMDQHQAQRYSWHQLYLNPHLQTWVHFPNATP